MQRTCVGWPARSVRSLRYHGTVLCLADSAPNFTANRSLVAPPPSGICYFTPNICSSLPWWRLPLSGGQKGQLELGEGFKVSEMPREDAIFCGSGPSLTLRFARDISQVPRRKPQWSIVNLVPSAPDKRIEASDVPDSIRRQAYRHLGKARS